MPLGLEYRTVVPLDIPGQVAGITVNREQNFRDKEATFLTLLAPHLAMARGKLKRLDTLQKTLDSVPFPTPDELQQIGLTARESEILFWVIQGKRDSEILAILSDETRTGACLEALDRIKRYNLGSPKAH